jgi:GLPGLI family protein
MNKLIITWTVLVVLLTTKVVAQEFQGMAVYESKTSLGDLKFGGKDMNDEMSKQIMESMRKQFEKTFVLHFDRYESVYEEEQKLEAPSKGFSLGVMSSGGGAVTYKNVKNKVKLVEKEFLGKEFLITDSLKVWNWELQNETKKIGDYTCYKAVSVARVTKEDLEEYEKAKAEQEKAKTSFFTVGEPKEKVTTVWYTPEIPVSQGPAEFWGLPGLILEASFDDTIILCSKIVLNPKDKIEIKKPKRGKKVTNDEYERLIESRLEQMTDGDGTIHIEISR